MPVPDFSFHPGLDGIGKQKRFLVVIGFQELNLRDDPVAAKNAKTV